MTLKTRLIPCLDVAGGRVVKGVQFVDLVDAGDPVAAAIAYDAAGALKTSTLPAVRVEPALRSDAEAVLDEGESLSDFVAACVRDGVTWRRTQGAFLARAQGAVVRSERENNGISPQEVLRRMDARLDTARQRLAAGKPRAGQ